MAEDIWGEKPQIKTGTILGTEIHNFYDIEEIDAWLEKVKKVLIDDREKIHFMTVKNHEKRIKKLEKQAETLRFLFGEEGVKTANLEKIQIWREKAEKWNELCEGLEYGGNTPVRDILQEINLIDRDNELRRKKLEAVNTWFSGRFLSIWDKIPVEGLIVHKKRGLEVLRKILEAEGK